MVTLLIMQQKKQNFGEPIDRLLRNYEGCMRFISYVMQVLLPGNFTEPFWKRVKDGPISHWPELRKALVNIHTDEFDTEKFMGPDYWERPEKMAEMEFTQPRMNAARVALWNKSSRRVYRVSEDLELLLAATSLEDVDWSMIN